ncbi:MAG: hypothetical protein O2816_02925 [Planctomycetota bacterium]|nr:hypothetical protein [Planctomycetota bacterium]
MAAQPTQAIADSSGRDIAFLQRRLAKLSAILELQEGELRRVAGKLSEDPGIASASPAHAGLDAMDPEVERKREIMSRIFQANVELRRRLDSRASPGR